MAEKQRDVAVEPQGGEDAHEETEMDEIEDYSLLQREHVLTVRRFIDSKDFPKLRNDWQNILLEGVPLLDGDQKLDVARFYIKPIVSFVPHLLFPGYVPFCPRCLTNQFVDVQRAVWVLRPIKLLGVDSYRLLDTKQYKCTSSGCGSWFAGYNPKSLRLASTRITSALPFRRMEKWGFAIDSALYDFIVARMSDVRRRIQIEVRDLAMTRYIQAQTDYLVYVNNNQVVTNQAGSANSIDDSHIHPVNERKSLSPGPGGANSNPSRTNNKRILDFVGTVQNKKAKAGDDLCLTSLLYAKKRKKRSPVLPEIGVSIIQELMSCGFQTARDVLNRVRKHRAGQDDEFVSKWIKLRQNQLTVESNVDPSITIFTWTDQIECHYENAEQELKRAKGGWLSFESDAASKIACNTVPQHNITGTVSIAGEANCPAGKGNKSATALAANAAPEVSFAEAPKVPEFSAFYDKNGYAGHIISEHVIKKIQSAIQHRPPLTDASMRGSMENVDDRNSRLAEARTMEMTTELPVMHANTDSNAVSVPVGHPMVPTLPTPLGQRPSVGNKAPLSLPPLVEKMWFGGVANPVGTRIDWRVVCEVCGFEGQRHSHDGQRKLFGKGQCTMSLCAVCLRSERAHKAHMRSQNRPVTTSWLMGKQCVFVDSQES